MALGRIMNCVTYAICKCICGVNNKSIRSCCGWSCCFGSSGAVIWYGINAGYKSIDNYLPWNWGSKFEPFKPKIDLHQCRQQVKKRLNYYGKCCLMYDDCPCFTNAEQYQQLLTNCPFLSNPFDDSQCLLNGQFLIKSNDNQYFIFSRF